MKTALFSGTFDPPSLGHLDIIQRAMHVCDKLYVGIASNIIKPRKSFFNTEEKVSLLKEITSSIPQVEVVHFSELAVEFAKKNKVDFLIRGLRAFSDFEFEFRMALANRKISGLETVFLMADAKHAHISSTLIRELAAYGARLHDFVPKGIEEQVFTRLAQK